MTESAPSLLQRSWRDIPHDDSAERAGKSAKAVWHICAEPTRSSDTLERLDLDGRPIASALNYMLTRAPQRQPLESELHMRGIYRYLGDGAVFEGCITGWRLPVSREADNPALKRAYAQSRSAPGEPVLIDLIGRVTHHPAMEGEDPARSLVPVQFINTWPGQDCGPARH